jgi:hypothetical protein
MNEQTKIPTNKIRELKVELLDLVCFGELNELNKFCLQHPYMLHQYDFGPSTYEMFPGSESILCRAVQNGRIEIVLFLLERNVFRNSVDGNGWTALCWAVTNGRMDLVKLLLDAGADPNIHNALRSCNASDVKNPIAMAKLLLDHGADINGMDELGTGKLVTTLDWVDTDKELAAYLRSRGAKYAYEILGRPQPSEKEGHAMRKVVIDFMSSHYGKVHPQSLGQMTGDTEGIDLHWIPAGAKLGMFGGTSQFTYVFTTGLSQYAMPVPPGCEDYMHAELMLVLPSSWPLPDKAIRDDSTAWPLGWLRQLASYPIENKTWFGGPICIVPNEVPPKPLGPGCPFTAWMLVTSQEKNEVIKAPGKRKILLYTAYPLYTEEYQLERNKGLDDLTNAFEKIDLQSVIDYHRPNAARLK